MSLSLYTALTLSDRALRVGSGGVVGGVSEGVDRYLKPNGLPYGIEKMDLDGWHDIYWCGWRLPNVLTMVRPLTPSSRSLD